MVTVSDFTDWQIFLPDKMESENRPVMAGKKERKKEREWMEERKKERKKKERKNEKSKQERKEN